MKKTVIKAVWDRPERRINFAPIYRRVDEENRLTDVRKSVDPNKRPVFDTYVRMCNEVEDVIRELLQHGLQVGENTYLSSDRQSICKITQVFFKVQKESIIAEYTFKSTHDSVPL